MITPIVALASVAFAASAPEEKPYVLQKASSAMVNYAVKYRKTGVPESQASSAAAQIVDKVLAEPQATAFAGSAASYLAVNGAQINGENAEKLASKASSFYDEIATKPGYTNFAKQVAQQTGLFDINRAVDDAQNKLAAVGSKDTDRARNAVIKANAAYRSLSADPQGAKAIETGKQLGGRVARDFKVDTAKVKLKANVAKANLLTRFFS